jgi:uncharacterized protein YggE
MRLLLISAVSTILFSCQEKANPPSVSVTGAASVRVVPDMVQLSLKADNTRPAMKLSVSQTQEDIEAIIAVCKKYVSRPDDIRVSNISTNKDYEYRNNREIFTGYNATQVLEVTLRDITRLQAFTEELLATRISRIDNINYNHTKADSIQRAVSLLALEDAKRTAEKMCDKMQVKLGSIDYLSNFEGGDRPARHTSESPEYSMNLYSKSFAGTGFRITPEILEFTDRAYARFKLN